MSRLTKKCLAVSAISHGLLLLIVFVGSAFVPPRPKSEAPAFELIPIGAQLVNEDILTGGNPNAAPPARPSQAIPEPVVPRAQPEQKVEPKSPPKPEPKSATRPEAKPERQPKPGPETKAETTAANDRFKLDDISRRVKIDPRQKPEKSEAGKKTAKFDLHNLVKRTIHVDNSDSSNSEDTGASKAQDRAARRSAALEQVLGKLENGMSGSTRIESLGPGGAAFAGYGIFVRQEYEKNWITPAAGRDDEPVVQVQVTIAKSGKVLRTKILKRSGHGYLDRSVQQVLDRVRTFPPFPEGTTDQERDFIVNFNLNKDKAG